jgi:hypothetical protein
MAFRFFREDFFNDKLKVRCPEIYRGQKLWNLKLTIPSHRVKFVCVIDTGTWRPVAYARCVRVVWYPEKMTVWKFDDFDSSRDDIALTYLETLRFGLEFFDVAARNDIMEGRIQLTCDHSDENRPEWFDIKLRSRRLGIEMVTRDINQYHSVHAACRHGYTVPQFP